MIKGWLDGTGETHKKVYDVAWSGDRKLDAKTGKLPAVGNTVDVPSATPYAIGGVAIFWVIQRLTAL